jgi:hypothetical protein
VPEFYRSEQVLEGNDESVEVGNIRVLDGDGDVVEQEGRDLVVPLQNVEDALVALANLEASIFSA